MVVEVKIRGVRISRGFMKSERLVDMRNHNPNPPVEIGVRTMEFQSRREVDGSFKYIIRRREVNWEQGVWGLES